MTSIFETVNPDNLSSCVRNWLNRGNRKPVFKTASAICDFLNKSDTPPTEELIEFELIWGGWECEKTRIGYFERLKDGKIYEGTVYDENPDCFLFECAQQNFEQFFTLMSEDGKIYDWLGDGTVPFQSSQSLLHLLESRVLFNELYTFPDWYCLKLETEESPMTLATRLGLKPEKKANDEFESWYTGDYLRLQNRACHAICYDLQPALWLHILDKKGENILKALQNISAVPVFKRSFHHSKCETLV